MLQDCPPILLGEEGLPPNPGRPSIVFELEVTLLFRLSHRQTNS